MNVTNANVQYGIEASPVYKAGAFTVVRHGVRLSKKVVLCGTQRYIFPLGPGAPPRAILRGWALQRTARCRTRSFVDFLSSMRNLSSIPQRRAQTCRRTTVRTFAGPSRSAVLSHRSTPIVFPHLGSGMLFARSTGLRIWPAAIILSEFMISKEFLDYRNLESTSTSDQTNLLPKHHWDWQACTVVELGCGLGLGSIVAAQLGAKVSPANPILLERKQAAAGAVLHFHHRSIFSYTSFFLLKGSIKHRLFRCKDQISPVCSQV